MNIASDKPNAQSCLSHEAGRGDGEVHFIISLNPQFDPVIRLALVGRSKLLMSFCRLIAPLGIGTF